MLEGEERERREESTTQEVDIEVAKRVETSLRPFNCGSFNFRGLNFVVEFWGNTWSSTTGTIEKSIESNCAGKCTLYEAHRNLSSSRVVRIPSFNSPTKTKWDVKFS